MDEAQAVESYKRAIADLTFNSKPIITGLTVKALEMAPFAPAIVRVVEGHVKAVPRNIKLPSLYLLDSIVKNLGQPWTDLFSERLTDTFCDAYTSLEEDKTRKEFLRVFTLWWGVFPEVHLREIEQRLRLKRSARPSKLPRQPQQPYHPAPQAPAQPYSLVQPLPYQGPVQRLTSHAIGLLNHLRTVLMAPPHAFPPNTVPDLIYRVGGRAELDPVTMRDLDGRCRLPDPRPALDLLNSLLAPPQLPFPLQHQPMSAPVPMPLPNLPMQVPRSPVIVPGAPAPKSASPGDMLYDALPLQCKTCGFRFSDSEQGKDRYREHLDAHFKRNMRLRDRHKRLLARDWLQTVADWSEGLRPTIVEKPVPVFFDTLLKEAKEASAVATAKQSPSLDGDTHTSQFTVKAGDRGRDQLCLVCQEPLDIFYDNEADEWMFRNAVERDDGQVCHRSCVEESPFLGAKRSPVEPLSESDAEPGSKRAKK